MENTEKHSEFEKLIKKFNSSRGNLLLVVALSTLNIILYLAGTDFFFLFSATFPMLTVVWGEIFAASFDSNVFLFIGIALAFLSVSFYVVCYLLTNKYRGWIVAALIALSLDSMLLLWLLTSFEFDISTIIEIAIRVWVMYYLVSGTRTWIALRKMPRIPDGAAIEGFAAEAGQTGLDEAISYAANEAHNDNKAPPVIPESADVKAETEE